MLSMPSDRNSRLVVDNHIVTIHLGRGRLSLGNTEMGWFGDQPGSPADELLKASGELLAIEHL